MHAAARDETGMLAVVAEFAAFEFPAGATPAGVVEISETPCGFASSFFHTRHLDPIWLVFQSRIRVRLEGTRLGIVKIIQGLLDVKRNAGNQI